MPDPLDLRPLGATGDPLDPALATVLAPSLTQSCTIRRKGASNDALGSEAGSYSDHLTGVACNLVEEQQDPREAESGSRVVAVRRFKLLVAVGTDVKPTDRALLLSALVVRAK